MTESSILPKKIGKQPPGRERGVFSPAMLEDLCQRVAEGMTALLGAPCSASLDSVGLTPLSDAISEQPTPLNVGILEIRGLPRAALLGVDTALLHHVVDLQLGGDPEEDDTPVSRRSSPLDDRFCKRVANEVAAAFDATCATLAGPSISGDASCSGVAHDGGALAIAPRLSETLVIQVAVKIGDAGRQGKLSLCVPLTTLDAIFGSPNTDNARIRQENDPWFVHMKNSVLDMDLDMLCPVHTLEMRVAELSRLDVGTLITLPDDAAAEVPLMLEDGGDVIAHGRLGVSSGQRAVRLAAAPDKDFLEPLAMMVDEDPEAIVT